MSKVIWGRYEQAYEAIHNAILSSLTSAPEGKKVTKIEFEWNADKSLKTLKAFQNEELIFTLTFEWNPDGTLKRINRTG
ncbi:hypothetical protein J7K06_01150 [Candidatus Bathyarchaeota archaeon]|nr:hypothetical protein [Candidatus Bathyarchaeota archaeon]